MAVIKGTETIAQYKITKWVNENFVDGFIKVNYLTDDTAELIDIEKNSMRVKYDKDTDSIIEI